MIKQLIDNMATTHRAGVFKNPVIENGLWHSQGIMPIQKQVAVIKTKRVMSVRGRVITERDKQILNVINRFGFMTVIEVAAIFNMQEQRAYARLKVLNDAGLIKHERILHSYPGAYWITREGRETSGSLLTPIREPRLATFEHELKVIQVYLALKNKYGDNLIWITAREILSGKIADAKTTKEAFRLLKSKIPDALILRDGKRFAIEVELSLKSTPRLKKILADYSANMSKGVFDGVLYYTDKDTIAERLEKLISTTAFAGQFRIIRLTK